jgi:hypothetical protein
MRRYLLGLVAAPLFAGCASMAAPSSDGGMRLDPMDATPSTMETPGFFTQAGEAALSVPETVLWWPYKIVSGALKGAYDGVAGGVQDAPMPLAGIVAAPVTGAMGLLRGVGKGAALDPHYIKNTAMLAQAFGKPWW